LRHKFDYNNQSPLMPMLLLYIKSPYQNNQKFSCF
jgi:hypothetical protein